MTNQLPVNFRKSGENIIASYDFFDIATGIAYKTFYGVVASQALLTPIALDSTTFKIGAADIGTTFKDVASKSFILYFTNPAQIQGKAILNYTQERVTAATPGIEVATYFILTKINLDGTRTELKRISGAFYGGITGSTANRLSLDFDLPLLNIKRGESLELNVNIWGDSNPSSGSNGVWLYTDGGNRVGSTANESQTGAKADTTLKLLLPFRVQS